MSIVRPALFPDEFAQGYLGRALQINGLNRKDRLGAIAFLRSVAGVPSAPGLPIVEFMAHFAGVSFDSFLRGHTTIPLRRAIVRNPSSASLKNCSLAALSLGMTGLRPGAYLCEHCVEEDIDFHGQSYWRREHQLPGLFWCPKHLRPLVVSDDDRAFLHTPAAVAPKAQPLDAKWVERIMSHKVIDRFASVVSELATAGQSLPEEKVALALRPLLESHGIHVGYGQVVRPLLSDVLCDSVDERWLRSVIPGLLEQPRGVHWRPVDGASVGAALFITPVVYLVAFAMICRSADEAVHALLASAEDANSSKRSVRQPGRMPEIH